MNKRRLLFTIILMALLVLMGCSQSYESFNLTRIEQDITDNTHPYLFIIAPKKDKKRVKFYYHGHSGGFKEKKQKLKDVIITENELIIETKEECFIFEKISDVLVIDENNISYEIDYEKNYPNR